jgi:flagellar hook protein FlgE
MYSGISGMKNFQTKLDVIGNNIANVNTYGFKKGRVNFKDLVSQSIAGASAPGEVLGGVNPKQVGLGAQLGTIDTIDTQGSLQTTGRSLDLAVSGDGYFVLTDSDGDSPTYTRSGNFYLDSGESGSDGGRIVNADGKYLKGEDGIINIPTTAKSFSIGSDGVVSYVDEIGELQEAGQIILAKFPNNGGLEKIGSNEYQMTTNSGEAVEGVPSGETGAGSIVAGALEMSNVDLSEEFTEMIVAQRGFQANTRIITTSDEILQELINLKR